MFKMKSFLLGNNILEAENRIFFPDSGLLGMLVLGTGFPCFFSGV